MIIQKSQFPILRRVVVSITMIHKRVSIRGDRPTRQGIRCPQNSERRSRANDLDYPLLSEPTSLPARSNLSGPRTPYLQDLIERARRPARAQSSRHLRTSRMKHLTYTTLECRSIAS